LKADLNNCQCDDSIVRINNLNYDQWIENPLKGGSGARITVHKRSTSPWLMDIFDQLPVLIEDQVNEFSKIDNDSNLLLRSKI
jgi:hypothetical protein